MEEWTLRDGKSPSGLQSHCSWELEMGLLTPRPVLFQAVKSPNLLWKKAESRFPPHTLLVRILCLTPPMMSLD